MRSEGLHLQGQNKQPGLQVPAGAEENVEEGRLDVDRVVEIRHDRGLPLEHVRLVALFEMVVTETLAVAHHVRRIKSLQDKKQE